MNSCLTADGNWLELREPAAAHRSAPALFLDRDGAAIEEAHFLSRPEDVVLIPHAAETIRRANDSGWHVVLVTNQSGIGRGYFGWEAFAAVQTRLSELLAAQGARITMVLACPHHAEGLGQYSVANHPWRKPNPGMLLEAARHLPIEMERSWIVGDRVADIAAGQAAGLAGGFHVLTGYGATHRDKATAVATAAYRVIPVSDIGEVAAHLFGETQSPARPIAP